ncbi:hypothetical protein MBLNU230_g1960t1 [Neophaeotheca triangularis]
MPAPANVRHLPSTQPAARTKPKSPNKVVAEQEAQWLFTQAELDNTPSVQDGMSAVEEREMRAKGINFIVQVGIMLKLPQLTLSTAGVFFQRFLMRASLKKERNGIVKLHQFQSAATALFLATKVEESCRKMKELITAFCRVAQKNPNLIVDEQSKDFWKWRDCILYNEDVLLEVLCFDLTVESPHRLLFHMLKFYGHEHNKPFRNSAWALVTDANNTILCLMCTSRVICVAAFYVACRMQGLQIPDSANGLPWWETQKVRTKDLRRAVTFITTHYEQETNKVGKTNGAASTTGSEGNKSLYAGMTTPMDVEEDASDLTRMRGGHGTLSPYTSHHLATETRRTSNASSIGTKRGPEQLSNSQPNDAPSSTGVGRREGDGVEPETKKPRLNGDRRVENNGEHAVTPDDPNGSNNMKHEEEALRVEDGNEQAEVDVQGGGKAEKEKTVTTTGYAPEEPVGAQEANEGGSEEGELEE